MKNFFNIPKEVLAVAEKLENESFEAYLIGGCVRDMFLQKAPKDWDITTNATPEEIQKIFPDSFYENSFGTVGVKVDTTDETLQVIEVTPYRIEGKYTNNRHPDEVRFSKNLSDDLKRRDFTVNAIALRVRGEEIEVVDEFGGKSDLQKGILRTVGLPSARFEEDGLRILRAVRLSAQLQFEIDPETEMGIVECGHLLQNISAERIRDEFVKIIMSKDPEKGIKSLRKFGILKFILPELEEGIGATQNKAHMYDVFEHLVKTLAFSASKDFPLETRLAALLHDIGKPATRRFSPEKKEYTFYGHEVVGARMAKKILTRLKFPLGVIERVTSLVRWHMFFSDTETITLSAVRRMIQNVGKDQIWTLMDVRACDRIGTGRPKEAPFRLRKYHAMIEEALRDPVSVSQLKVDGKDLMAVLGTPPGKHIGYILHALLEEVLDDPKKNTKEYLENRAKELCKLPENELKFLGEKGKEKKEEEDEKLVASIRKRHFVE